MVADDQLVIAKTVQFEGKTTKIAVLQIILQIFAQRQKYVWSQKQESRMDSTSEAATIGTSATAGEQVKQIETMFQKHSIYDANYDS